MYDVVVVGQGLSGLLSAIWAGEQGKKVALVSKGTGKLLQSTGFMDFYGKKPATEMTKEAVDKFKQLMTKLNLPYLGDFGSKVSVVTGSGYLKETILYPETVVPVPDSGRVLVVGFTEIADFQPAFVKGNLERERPELVVDTLTVSLEQKSLRTMTQLDAARLLDKKENRAKVLKQIKAQMQKRNLGQPELYIFPASLGIENWRTVLQEFSVELGAPVTEAPGMPPNAPAVRLFESLRKAAIRMGTRFYSDTEVIGSHVEENLVRSLKIQTSNHTTEIIGRTYIIAAGGVLGGGHVMTAQGLKDTVLGLETDAYGQYSVCPENVLLVGASRGTKELHCGITGGVSAIQSSYESVLSLTK